MNDLSNGIVVSISLSLLFVHVSFLSPLFVSFHICHQPSLGALHNWHTLPQNVAHENNCDFVRSFLCRGKEMGREGGEPDG